MERSEARKKLFKSLVSIHLFAVAAATVGYIQQGIMAGILTFAVSLLLLTPLLGLKPGQKYLDLFRRNK